MTLPLVAPTTPATNGTHAALTPSAADDSRFADLIDTATGVVGRVVGSEQEPAGAHQFCIWAADEARSLDVGHIVVAFSEDAAVIGVVDEPRRFSDLRSFLDDYFDRRLADELAAELATRRPEILVFCVNVLATKHVRADVTSHRPPVAGPVYFATRAAIDYALGRHEFSGVPIPALLHTNGNPERATDGRVQRHADGHEVFQRAPIWVDGDYLLGPEAGHANWTGQSGLATKTSHALFLTTAVFQNLRAQPKPQKVAALMFNVKGPDLLWLDKPADPEPDLAEAYQREGVKGLRPEDHEAYQALGLVPTPFATFRIFAPFKPHQEPDARGEAVYLDQGRHHIHLNTLRNRPAESEGVVFPILWDLEQTLAWAHRVFESSDLDDKFWGVISDIRDQNIASLKQLDAYFNKSDEFFETNPEKNEWNGHNKYTLKKARNRFRGLTNKLGGLLSQFTVQYGGLPRADGPFGDQELRVVDIANCNTRAQELVVTTVINSIWKMAEEDTLGVDKVIVFVDELNKYAPAGGEGGLRDTLVDIAARGRHLNVVLFGAQQFRSKVDSEVLGICGTALYGRVGDEEIVNAAYRSLSETARAELLGLPKGRLLIRHAHFRAPLFGTFPYPPTIPGMLGQKIFNGSGSALPFSHPADGLFRVLQRQMGDRAPRKSEVRTMADGLDTHALEELAHKLDLMARDAGGRPGFDPWYRARSELQRLKSRQR